MSECIFCKIIQGEIKADVVYKDENVIAFNDINPQAPVHILVVPLKHIERITDSEATDGKLLESVFKTVQKLATDKKLDKGFRVVANCGAEGGQTVDHIHFHVLGGRSLQWPPG